jgi:hypothetical protein
VFLLVLLLLLLLKKFVFNYFNLFSNFYLLLINDVY